MVPVIEVVATVLAALPLHRKGRLIRLMSDHDALLEGCIEVLAVVSSVGRDLHSIKFVLCVHLGCEGVVRHPNVVAEKRHL